MKEAEAAFDDDAPRFVLAVRVSYPGLPVLVPLGDCVAAVFLRPCYPKSFAIRCRRVRDQTRRIWVLSLANKLRFYPLNLYVV